MQSTKTFILSFLSLVCLRTVFCSKLEFIGGAYSNLLVAVDSDVDPLKCLDIIDEIKSLLSNTSTKLYTATDGQAYFRDVTILIPSSWHQRCPGLQGSPADTYEVADIKITDNQPLSVNLSWTRQYKSCGESADDIFLSTGFLLSSVFNMNVKSNMMLHEWAKFRYGVFEEYGYLDDKVDYNGCYAREQELLFTSCSNSVLSAVSNDTRANCRTELNTASSSILSELRRSGSTSVMSMPHVDNLSKFCTKETHNSFAPTKHNALCDRKSISEVIFNHRDFSKSQATQIQQTPITNFQIVETTSNFPGIAFLVEDSDLIRTESRLQIIKQSAAQIVNLMTPGSLLQLTTIVGNIANVKPSVSIVDEQSKVQFLSNFPDTNTQSLFNRTSSHPFLVKYARADNNNMYEGFNKIFEELKKRTPFKWHIIVVTNSPSISITQARDAFLKDSSFTLSVATFENNTEWLKMYETSLTQNVIPLPISCVNQESCLQLSTFIVDDFVQNMRSQYSARFLQKVASALIQSTSRSFTVGPSTNNGNFHLFVSLLTAGGIDGVIIRSPSGVLCPVAVLHGYDLVGKMNTVDNGCRHQEGTWEVTQFPGTSLHIYALVEASITDSNINIVSSIGASKYAEFNPNSQLTPIYTRVTFGSELPVIGATVELKLISTNPLSSTSPTTRSLKDDGVDPDLISNDGVYSGYIQDFSTTSAAFHIGEVTVTTNTGSTRAITSLEDTNGRSEAAMLDSRMSQKCCGYRVPFRNVQPIPYSRHVSILPGFKTSEGFDVNRLPPSRIQSIQTVDDTGSVITLQFQAPSLSFSNQRVDHYDLSCSYIDPSSKEEISSTHPISSPSTCDPVEPGQIQLCRLNRDGLTRDYIGSRNSTQDETIILQCGIMGVNSAGVPGQLSISRFDINIDYIYTTPVSKIEDPECKNVSDGCLPIAVFWGLIGCIGGLVLIILIIVICWCLSYRRGKKTLQQDNKVLMTNSRENSSPPMISSPSGPGLGGPLVDPNNADKDTPQYNVYVNKAYIQETDGQMKLVAADGELLPFEHQNNNHGHGKGHNGGSQSPIAKPPRNQYPTVGMTSNRFVLPVPQARRRSVSISSPQETDWNQNPTKPYEDHNDRNDMRIYKSNPASPPAPPPKPNFNTYTSNPTTFQSNTLRKHQAPDNNVPVARNRYPKQDSVGYANSDKQNRLPLSSVPRDSKPAPVVMDVEIPVYASVNRNGRRTPVNASLQPNTNNNSVMSTFQRPKSLEINSTPNEGDKNMPVKNRFGTGTMSSNASRPQSAQSMSHRRSPSAFSARLDAFPSSESDTYSDMSRSIPVKAMPPPMPPPFPKSGGITVPTSSTTIGPSFMRNTPNRHNLPTNVSKTLPRRHREISSPIAPPPPPPPPQRQMQEVNSDEYDDDSDNWDDDDFELHPVGTSYA